MSHVFALLGAVPIVKNSWRARVGPSFLPWEIRKTAMGIGYRRPPQTPDPLPLCYSVVWRLLHFRKNAVNIRLSNDLRNRHTTE